tara:strand:+ start:684 stop:1739 length:1056 start_codon:yes stop_codon:yes gene_type:complete
MSIGNSLQEMENAVTKNAAAADPMQSVPTSVVAGQSIEDLGGPTPENYKTDDDSAKLKDPGSTLAKVRDAVNKGAKAPDPMKTVNKGVAKEEVEETSEEVVAESEVEEEVVSVDEDITALLSGEELSEEFQEKAKLIFEAAIASKVAESVKQIEEKYEEKLVEELSTYKEELVERVDSYLEYVSEEWIQENRIEIEKGLKSEMTESFLAGMRGLFEEHYVSIPEDKYDVVENMVEKLDEMESRLNEQIEKNITLNQRLGESVADNILADVCEGLAVSQKEKMASLAEGVEFESEEKYRESLKTLKESYFPAKSTTEETETPQMVSEEASSEAPAGSSMNAYLKALQFTTKN